MELNDKKIDNLKKWLIRLGNIFTIISAGFLIGLITLIVFSCKGVILKIFTIVALVFFDLAIVLYLISWILKVIFYNKNQYLYENEQWNELWDNYSKEKLPIDVGYILEYYSQVLNGGHLQFFENMQIDKLEDIISILVKNLPDDFSKNLKEAYEKYKLLKVKTTTKNQFVEVESCEHFEKYDCYFCDNTQRYENFIKMHTKIINEK